MAEMDLITWYLAQLEDDEEAARDAGERGPGDWLYRTPWRVKIDPEDAALAIVLDADETTWKPVSVTGWLVTEAAVHIARHDPAHILADIAAKRAIAALHTGMHECSSFGDAFRCVHEFEACDTVRHLASVYADRPGYDPAWAPS